MEVKKEQNRRDKKRVAPVPRNTGPSGDRRIPSPFLLITNVPTPYTENNNPSCLTFDPSFRTKSSK